MNVLKHKSINTGRTFPWCTNMAPLPHPSRDGICSSPGYIGTLNDFLLQTSWLRRFNVDHLMNAQCSRSITCSVIGVINSDGLYIEPHGGLFTIRRFHVSWRFNIGEHSFQFTFSATATRRFQKRVQYRRFQPSDPCRHLFKVLPRFRNY